MLQEQFMATFTLFQPGRISNLAPELNLLLASLVYWLSIWQGRASPGSELMNLRYRNEHAMEATAAAAAAAAGSASSSTSLSSAVQPPWLQGGRTGIDGPGLSQQQKLGYAAAFVGLPYLWLRLQRLAAQREWGQRQDDRLGLAAWRLLRGADAAHKVGHLLNLWVFLYQGKYRTLTERLLGARLVYKQPNMSRLISFEYLNRQLVWQELSEFLLFLLPLINVAKVKQFILKLLPRVPAVAAGGGSGVGNGTGQYPLAGKEWSSSSGWQQQPQQQDLQEYQQGQQPAEQQEAGGRSSSSSSSSSSSNMHRAADVLRPIGPCPICGVHEVLVPFVAYPCRHLFCYYCLRSHTEADQGFCCPVDGLRVDAMQRYTAPVTS
ncbi:Pex12 amino terminal region-domain-containing protein [Scenedesmus sp. NREL 46B-D3]|nr:Pex12 amino terminal region-domain-containing protein [Scenedesmus sp. NREL 46B-D3]